MDKIKHQSSFFFKLNHTTFTFYKTFNLSHYIPLLLQNKSLTLQSTYSSRGGNPLKIISTSCVYRPRIGLPCDARTVRVLLTFKKEKYIKSTWNYIIQIVPCRCHFYHDSDSQNFLPSRKSKSSQSACVVRVPEMSFYWFLSVNQLTFGKKWWVLFPSFHWSLIYTFFYSWWNERLRLLEILLFKIKSYFFGKYWLLFIAL